MSEEEDAISAMRQRLMTADEVYVYKIPPLKDSGGHRAEDWNLAAPLKTCNLLVERRGDAFVLEFQHSGQVFAMATCDVTKGGNAAVFLEQTVDSSRYFVVKIQGAGGREAVIGFGFRDRDEATDLRESLQHYQKAMGREAQSESAPASTFHVPQMAEGEKIHVNVKGGSKRSKEKSSSKGGGMLLLKKPPPPADGEGSSAKITVEKVSINMGDIDLNASWEEEHDGEKGEEGSDGAVYVGDEDQWDTEFELK